MRYVCLACDFDGTLASNGGSVKSELIQALIRLASSGRKLVLSTGRRLEDLFEVFPNMNLFDYVVCENGALLYQPSTKLARILAEPPPRSFIDKLREAGVTQLEIGRVVLGTWHPAEATVLRCIHEMGLDLCIAFNKGAVMILPSGVNKGFGLQAALREMNLSPHNVVSIGDAENDHALLSMSECGVAVANALPLLKEYADLVMAKDHGDGVMELIDRILKDDLADCTTMVNRHRVSLGVLASSPSERVTFPPFDFRILLIGPSQSGKSTVTMSLLHEFALAGYQYCVIDPEGEYDRAPHSVTVGNEHYEPNVADVISVLENPQENVVVNLLSVPLNERAVFLTRIYAAIQELRHSTGRPHWVVIDEAHHMLHPYWDQTIDPVWTEPGAVMIVTIDPHEISQKVLQGIDLTLAVGGDPATNLQRFANAIHQELLEGDCTSLRWGEALAWFRHQYGPPRVVRIATSPVAQQRHLRKYSAGDVGAERSFYFTGPKGQFNIKCQNLFLFMQIGEGIDDETWLYHLNKGDYSAWFENVIQDQNLAEGAHKIEQCEKQSAARSRQQIRELIERYYTFSVQLSH